MDTRYAFLADDSLTPIELYEALQHTEMVGLEERRYLSVNVGIGGGSIAGQDSLPEDTDWKDALRKVSLLRDVSVVATPGATELQPGVSSTASLLIAHVEASHAYRFAVLDIPRNKTPEEARDYTTGFASKSAAFYYPWVVVPNPAFNSNDATVAKDLLLPPSGFICGVYARTDRDRGVFKAPANEVIRSAIGFEHQITSVEQERLNETGVNSLRYLAGKGYCVLGARTASPDPDCKYVDVRRYGIYLERSIDQGTRWTVFEPDNETLWSKVRDSISTFLEKQWRAGGLLGHKPEEAFFVKCDRTTMTQDDIDKGKLVCVIGVALLKPAEFVIFRSGQWTAQRCPDCA